MCVICKMSRAVEELDFSPCGKNMEALIDHSFNYLIYIKENKIFLVCKAQIDHSCSC